MRSFSWASIFVSVLLTSQAYGASTEVERSFPRAEAQRFLVEGLRNIHLGKCEGGFCAKATAQELKSPPVPIRLAQLALAAGYLSGLAESCGINSKAVYFQQLMTGFRRNERLNDRQLALLAMVHGLKQGQTQRAMVGKTCPQQIKKILAGQTA